MPESKIRVLVFPCGSEIGLEVFRSLKYSRHVELVGANSVDDHGKFVYTEYFGNIPFVDAPDFEEVFQKLILEKNIDAVYPTMDQVISTLSEMGDRLHCKVLGSPKKTNRLALSKSKTYQFFEGKIKTPEVYTSLDDIHAFPVFSKPDIGYGSRGTRILHSLEEAKKRKQQHPEHLILEYLPGEEYTVDCFTDRFGKLLFVGPRKRGRIQKGISVNTTPAPELLDEVNKFAQKINQEVELRGAWFFQVKKNQNGELSLLEFATRLGGSSSLFRAKGINFALMAIFDAFNYPVEANENSYGIELDRALDQRFKFDFDYQNVYVDLDDCLILGDQINSDLVRFIYQSINKSKKIILITKHEKDLVDTLKKFRISSLFDELIHLKKTQEKADFMQYDNAIFIDDSFAERKKVSLKLRIPVFAPDAVASLITD
ncbi:MAG: ATP-grasp domain-containing protein [Algoriphagus sp.]|uniref:ATP-grasp domain-containing protein n=1 Tax=Algoriphagus sp. TaxID=1872435 RepID=UPI0026222AB5|nr:ATP-grasp domain-containing protein [Algoriphagus sp.]MDG1279251.1 ATP-grasp domain-containing protein [Algoriphagus sp.]